MPVTSFSFSPAGHSAISLEDIGTIMAHRFTAVSSGIRKPYSTICKLIRGGADISQWTTGYSSDTTVKEPIPPNWDILGDANHTIHTHADGAIEFTGNTATTSATFKRKTLLPKGSLIYFILTIDETLVGGSGKFEVNLYNDADVLVSGSVIERSPGDGSLSVALVLYTDQDIESPKIVIENGTWAASSGSLFVENFLIYYFSRASLETTNLNVFLYDIEENEVIAKMDSPLDISTLSKGITDYEFVFDDIRFPIVNGKEYYIIFTVSDPDYTGWETILTDAQLTFPLGLYQRNLFFGIFEMAVAGTKEANPDFPSNLKASPRRYSFPISSLSGTNQKNFSFNGGHMALEASTDYKMRVQVKPTSLAGYPGGGGANVVDLTVRIADRAGVLDTTTYQVALEDEDTLYETVLSFTTGADDPSIRLEVVWDASGINPTYTPNITYKVSGMYLWEDDGVTADPAIYQLPDHLSGYDGVFLATENATTEVMSQRSSGAWSVNSALSGVVVEVEALDTTTTQYLLNPAGDLFFNLDSVWPEEKILQPSAMAEALGYIEQGLALVGNNIPLPIQLRQDDVPYKSDWLVGLINNYGLNTFQNNGVYIWTDTNNQYGGRFLYHNGEIIPFSVPLGNGRVELVDVSVGSGTISSGTTTKYSLGVINFTLLKPAKVKLIWAVSAYDFVTLADRLVNIRMELDGTPVPDGSFSEDTNDKFFMEGGVSDPSNTYFLEFTFNDILAAGAHGITMQGTRGAAGNPQMTFVERIYTAPVASNNYQIKPTSMLEITYL